MVGEGYLLRAGKIPLLLFVLMLLIDCSAPSLLVRSAKFYLTFTLSWDDFICELLASVVFWIELPSLTSAIDPVCKLWR